MYLKSNLDVHVEHCKAISALARERECASYPTENLSGST
jgi:hypothetical protein